MLLNAELRRKINYEEQLPSHESFPSGFLWWLSAALILRPLNYAFLKLTRKEDEQFIWKATSSF